jgi:oligoribonuclease NrnB/cAMP/cGMP phosphodiesterase (DHH superfamily)
MIMAFVMSLFDYIFSKNLIENKLLDENFIEEVKSSLKKLNLDFKKQDLLKKGSQSSGNIFMTEDRVISKLKNVILKEIENYKETFKNSSDEYIKSWPKKFSVTWLGGKYLKRWKLKTSYP